MKCNHNIQEINTLGMINSNRFRNIIVNIYKCDNCNERFIEQIGSKDDSNYYSFESRDNILKRNYEKQLISVIELDNFLESLQIEYDVDYNKVEIGSYKFNVNNQKYRLIQKIRDKIKEVVK